MGEGKRWEVWVRDAEGDGKREKMGKGEDGKADNREGVERRGAYK